VEEFRFSDWPTDHHSIVTIRLTAPSAGVVALSLEQRGVPLNDRFGNGDVPNKVRQGWQNFFWDRIQRMMGYAAVNLDLEDD